MDREGESEEERERERERQTDREKEDLTLFSDLKIFNVILCTCSLFINVIDLFLLE